MAQELEDGEFWLPSDFLEDDDVDDLLLDFKPESVETKGSCEVTHGYTSSFGFNSDLSFPADSVMCSNETESDEDELVAGLTWKMARSKFMDSDLFSDYNGKVWKLSSSPQSTLCDCKRKLGGGMRRVPSPQVVAAEKASEKQTTSFHSVNQHFAPPSRRSPVYPPVRNAEPAIFNSSSAQALTQAQVTYLQQQAIKMIEVGFWGDAGRTPGSTMADWSALHQPQPLYQQPGPGPSSGIRPVFLRHPGLNKERTGTGVFLPRPMNLTPPKLARNKGILTFSYQ